MIKRKTRVNAKVKVSAVEAEPAWARRALLAATLGVLAMALLPMVVSVLPVAYFDVDPRSAAGATALTDLGPTGAAWVQVVAIALAAMGLAAHTAAGGRLRWGVLMLAAIGAAVCGWHLQKAGQPTTAGAWIAAAALGVAACHLAEHETPRRWITAALLAMVVPLTLQSLLAVYVEHPATVAMFQENREAFLRARGWLPGSPQAILYERRLMFPDAVGAFGLSNVYGSLVAALVMIAGAWTANLWRRGGPAATAVGVVLVGMGLWTLYLTHSRGAPAALALAAGLAVAWGAAAWWRRRGEAAAAALSGGAAGRVGGRMAGALVLAMIALVAVLVLARGAMGPPPPGRDDPSLSVYFRAQYWRAAVRVLEEADWATRLLGVGPDGFKERYLVAKDPLSPEEVESTHNVLLDWVVMLGMGGVAWGALVVMWVWRGGAEIAKPQAAVGASEDAGDEKFEGWQEMDGGDVRVGLALAAAVFGGQLVLQWARMTPEALVAWVFGAAGFLAVWVLGVSRVWSGGSRWERIGLLLAAAVLLIHNQIEMTFFNAAGSWPAWVMVAAAAGAGARGAVEGDAEGGTPNRKGGRWGGRYGAAAVVLAGAMWMAIGYAGPVTAEQAELAAAAMWLQRGNAPAATARLDEAAKRWPSDPTVAQWRVRLRLDEAAYWRSAGRTAEARRAVRTALGVLDEAFAAGMDTTAMLRLRAQVLQWAGAAFGDAGMTQTAAAVRSELVQRNPYGLQDRVALADLLWEVGRKTEARAAYAAAIDIDARLYLDRGKQLSQEERGRVAARAGMGK